MPYSVYAVKDRRAVGRLKYQMKKFVQSMQAEGVDPVDVARITNALNNAFFEASGMIDFDDDGTRIHYEPHNAAAESNQDTAATCPSGEGDGQSETRRALERVVSFGSPSVPTFGGL